MRLNTILGSTPHKYPQNVNSIRANDIPLVPSDIIKTPPHSPNIPPYFSFAIKPIAHIKPKVISGDTPKSLIPEHCNIEHKRRRITNDTEYRICLSKDVSFFLFSIYAISLTRLTEVGYYNNVLQSLKINCTFYRSYLFS